MGKAPVLVLIALLAAVAAVAGEEPVIARLDGTGEIRLCNNSAAPVYVIGEHTAQGFVAHPRVTWLREDGEEREVGLPLDFRQPIQREVPAGGMLRLRLGVASTTLAGDAQHKRLRVGVLYHLGREADAPGLVAESNILAAADNDIGMPCIDAVFSLRARAFTTPKLELDAQAGQQGARLRVIVLNDLGREVLVQANRSNWVVKQTWIHARTGKAGSASTGVAGAPGADANDFRRLASGQLASRFDDDRILHVIGLSYRQIRQLDFTAHVDLQVVEMNGSGSARIQGGMSGVVRMAPVPETVAP